MRMLASAWLLAGAVLAAQQVTSVVPLSGGDYAEITNAYGRTFHAASLGDGASFVRTFTADADLVAPDGTQSGRSALVKYGESRRGLRHWVTNLAIEAVPGGALGWAYVLQSRGRTFINGSLYRDQWVKTSEGWHIRRRELFPGNQMPPRTRYPAPSNIGAGRFTSRDYFEIETLLTRYNVGWDNGRMSDKGLLASLSFVADAVFERPGGETRRGREGIFDQVMANGPPRGGLHHWDNNLLVAVAPDGGVGTFGYDLLIDVDESGSPVRINGTGTLEHRVVRTAEGWLINYRIYKGLSAVPKISWPPPEFHLNLSGIARESGNAGVRKGTFEPVDYVDIEQLYVRNNIAFDSAGERGAAFARTFTSDGVWTRNGVTTSGSAALTALAAANTTGIETWTTNLTLESTRDGAVGRVYVLSKDGGDTKVPIADLGTFEDVLVKTPDGWRFKKRTYVSEPPVPDRMSAQRE